MVAVLRLLFVFVSSLLLTTGLAAAHDPGAPEASNVRPIWSDPIDPSSLSQWQVVEGDGTARIVDDPEVPERTYLRVEPGDDTGTTRVVGPSVPTALPVRVGFVFDTSTPATETEVRLVDVDGGLMTRVRVVAGSDLMLEDGQGTQRTLGAPLERHVGFHLDEDTVRAGIWDTTFETHAAVSDRPFDHIEIVVKDRWAAIDHFTVIPEGSGFVDFFQRHAIEGPHTPWRLTAPDGVREEVDAPGALKTDFSGVMEDGPGTYFSLDDARLAQHAHEVSLFFRSGTRAYTVGMPVLFGLDGSGTPLWSVDLTHVGRAGGLDPDTQDFQDVRTVTLRLSLSEEIELLPPTSMERLAFSRLHVATDPVAGALEVRVDDAEPVTVDMPGLTGLTTLGVGDVHDLRHAPPSVGSVYVDGVVAGYR